MEKTKPGKGKMFWILGAVLLIVGAGAVYIYLNFFSTGPLAVLSIDEGQVSYKRGTEWQAASSGMTLKQGDTVKTLDLARAKIIFTDSVLRLDSNTEIAIDGLNSQTVSLSQSIGRTWTRLLKISGIKEYSITTPDAVATVRGTGFAVDATQQDTEIKVVEGNVSVDTYLDENGEKKIISESFVETGEQTKVTEGQEKIETVLLNEDTWTQENKQLDEKMVQEIKGRLLKKYSFLADKAKSMYDLTDEQMNEYLDGWIAGKYSVKELIADGTIPSSAAALIPQEFKRY